LLADPEVTAVYVCIPHHLHREHVLLAARAGKHVLCEKPLAPTSEECRDMVNACQAAGVLFGVAFYRRFYPTVEKMRGLIAGGALGRLTSAQVVNHSYYIPRCDRLDDRSRWRTDLTTAGGGALNEVGSHRIDLLCYLLGDAREVSVQVETLEAWYAGEDKATVLIHFANRAAAPGDGPAPAASSAGS
jgi:predicted dehydrogenase